VHVAGRCTGARTAIGFAGLVTLALAAVPLASPILAEELAPSASRPSWRELWKWRETWTGVDASRDNALLYAGITVSPFSHIHEPGLRLKLAGGYGQYRYSGDRSTTPIPDIQSFAAHTYYGEALVGYLERFGPLTAKAFAGVSMIGHDIAPFDPENVVFGDEFGLKGVLELWLDLSDKGYASLDLSWNTAHNTRSARTRLGARLTPSLSGGLEAWLDLNAQSDCDLGWTSSSDCRGQASFQDQRTDLIDYTRGGVFVRYEWDGGEISLSGGVSGGSFMSGGEGDPEPYATVNWITQF